MAANGAETVFFCGRDIGAKGKKVDLYHGIILSYWIYGVLWAIKDTICLRFL